MSGECHSENSSFQLAVNYKEVNYKEVNYTSLRVKTEEGETITFPESFQFFVVKQESQDWDKNLGEITKKEIILEEGGHSCQTSEPADFNVNNSQFKQELQSSKPNVRSYLQSSKDGENMKTVEMYEYTERLYSDLAPTTEWSEETRSCAVSFQDCKIKEEPGDINQSEIPSQILSQDSSAYREEGGNNMRGYQSGDNFSLQPDLLLQHAETQTEREAQTDTWLEDVKKKSNLCETGGEKVFCDLCQSFTSQYFVLHMLIHKMKMSFCQQQVLTRTEDKPHECDICKKQFRDKHKLRKHVLTHTGEKPHECDICNKRFREKSKLRKHMFNHTGERPYECKLCKKRFKERYLLRTHTLTHTGERPHKCKLCKKGFTEKGTLHKHMLTHTGERPHGCDICNKRYRNKRGLRSHMLTHTGEGPHECKLCKKRFSERYLLRKHVMTHTGEKPYECNVCQKRFRQSGTLRSHMSTHSGVRPHKCNLCEKQFTERSALRKHMMTHSGGLPHDLLKETDSSKQGGHSCKTSDPVHFNANSGECEPCHPEPSKDGDNMDRVQPFKYAESLSTCSDLRRTKAWSEKTVSSRLCFPDYKIKREPEDINQFEIQIFSQDSSNYEEKSEYNRRGNRSRENFSVQPELSLQHVETQTERETQMDEWLEEEMEEEDKNTSNPCENGAEKVFCDLCQESLNSQYYRAHILVHRSEESFLCEICGKLFTEKRDMTEHVCIHTGEKCYLCDKQFLDKDDLKRHIFTHTEGKPYECDICKKRFRKKSKFGIHVIKHSGERPHKCNLCEKRFLQNCDLKRHMLTHTGEKPHECDICNKRFRGKTSLRNHLLTHTGERPHKCKLCEKQFLSNFNLKRHMLTHTGEKPHECEICKKRFREKGNFHKHVLTHIGNRPHKCNLCEKRFAAKVTLRKHMWTHSGETL